MNDVHEQFFLDYMAAILNSNPEVTLSADRIVSLSALKAAIEKAQ